jgi:hypothetical protein
MGQGDRHNEAEGGRLALVALLMVLVQEGRRFAGFFIVLSFRPLPDEEASC